MNFVIPLGIANLHSHVGASTNVVRRTVRTSLLIGFSQIKCNKRSELKPTILASEPHYMSHCKICRRIYHSKLIIINYKIN